MKRANYSDEGNPALKVALVERDSSPNGVALVSTYANGRRAPNDLVELARELQQADDFVVATTCSKLELINTQIKRLREDAFQIMEQARQNMILNHAACNFKKVPGNVYYLYERSSGQHYFSMLSPDEWGPSVPHVFQGAYRLEFDRSWTPFAQASKQKLMHLFREIVTPKNLLQHMDMS